MIKSAFSTEKNIDKAISQIKETLNLKDLSLLIYFASSDYDPEKLAAGMKSSFDNVPQLGCTTSGELVTGKMLDNSLVAMAFTNDELENVNVQIATTLQSDNASLQKAFKEFEKFYKKSAMDLEYGKYVGLVLTDGLSGCEEKVNDQIGNLTNIEFIGGSAGDDLKFKKTYVFANGKAYSDASVLAIFKPTKSFSILKTQSFKATNKVLKVTESNPSTREVISFNNEPATVAYSKALGVKEEELDKHIFKNPLGLIAEGNEIFVRSPRIITNKSMHFYCSMLNGMELSLLNSTDIVNDTQKALKSKEEELGQISGIINFNCILRTLDLKGQNKTEEYGKLFVDYPSVGFSTYGESYIGHINQTATMLVFGS